MFRASFRLLLIVACVCVTLAMSALALAQGPPNGNGNGGNGNGQYGGQWSGYQRHRDDWGWRGGHDRWRNNNFNRQPMQQSSSAWFQRPYPYHLDYYKMRWGGSYAPYFGNLYGTPFGTPQVVGNSGWGYGGWGWGVDGYGFGSTGVGGPPVGFPGVPYSYSMMPDFTSGQSMPVDGQTVIEQSPTNQSAPAAQQ